jgi:hypothetical protein
MNQLRRLTRVSRDESSSTKTRSKRKKRRSGGAKELLSSLLDQREDPDSNPEYEGRRWELQAQQQYTRFHATRLSRWLAMDHQREAVLHSCGREWQAGEVDANRGLGADCGGRSYKVASPRAGINACRIARVDAGVG